MKLVHPMAVAIEKARLSQGGYHDKVMLVARFLVAESQPEQDDEIINLLFDAAQRVKRRAMSRGEIGRIVDWLRNRPARKHEAFPKREVRDEGLINRVDELGFGLDKLRERSQPIPKDGRDILINAYPRDPYLCIGWSVSNFLTKRLSHWVEEPLDGAQYLAPNPMKAESMEKHDGTLTRKCHELVAERWYLAVEFDDATLDQQAGRLAWLGTKRGGGLPLTLVTFSGSKSLHGLYRAIHVPERALAKFYDKAIALGADPALWTPSQFTRMPLGFNTNKNQRQKVHFYHEENAVRSR
jgi:hypothetical protein